MTQGPVETPRTDAVVFQYDETGVPIVPVNFSRALEREVISLQQQLAARDEQVAALRAACMSAEHCPCCNGGVAHDGRHDADCIAALTTREGERE